MPGNMLTVSSNAAAPARASLSNSTSDGTNNQTRPDFSARSMPIIFQPALGSETAATPSNRFRLPREVQLSDGRERQGYFATFGSATISTGELVGLRSEKRWHTGRRAVVQPRAGTYSTAQSVTITTATSGATIRYTTTAHADFHDRHGLFPAVSVSTTTTLKAIAYKSGLTTAPSPPPPTRSHTTVFEGESADGGRSSGQSGALPLTPTAAVGDRVLRCPGCYQLVTAQSQRPRRHDL